MKIMIIVPEYPPYHIGGGGIVYKNLAEQLNKFGHDVVVLWGYYSSNSIIEKIRSETIEGIKFIRIPEVPYVKSKPYLRTAMPPNLRSVLSVPHIIKKEKPDIIHLHGYGLLFINFSSIISSIHNIPYIFTIHGYPKTPEINRLTNIIWTFYEKTLMKVTLNKASKITCVSNWIATDGRLCNYKHKVNIIYNGINQDIIKDKNLNIEINLTKKFNLPKNAQIICSVGRISKMKGFHSIIKIIPQLLIDFPNLYYFIIGADDGYKSVLVKLIKKLGIENHIIFTGFIDETLKYNIIKESEVYIVPSLWEPFGLTALEGLAMEKIVITSGAGGLGEFLSRSKNVMYYDPDDSNTIINVIKKAINHKIKYDQDEFLKRFNWRNIVEEYENLYNEIVNKNIEEM